MNDNHNVFEFQVNKNCVLIQSVHCMEFSFFILEQLNAVVHELNFVRTFFEFQVESSELGHALMSMNDSLYYSLDSPWMKVKAG